MASKFLTNTDNESSLLALISIFFVKRIKARSVRIKGDIFRTIENLRVKPEDDRLAS